MLRIEERQEAAEAAFETNRETLLNQLMTERQNRFFAAYMNNAKTRILIDVDLAAFAQAVT